MTSIEAHLGALQADAKKQADWSVILDTEALHLIWRSFDWKGKTEGAPFPRSLFTVIYLPLGSSISHLTLGIN